MARFGPVRRRLLRVCRSFAQDESGASFVLVAVLIIPLLGFIGLATDAGRGYLIKARLGDALDAAALAGAQEVFSDVNFESDVRMYFEANFPPDFMGARVTLAPPQVDAATSRCPPLLRSTRPSCGCSASRPCRSPPRPR
jgi:Flp pilus assembly protein TadG